MLGLIGLIAIVYLVGTRYGDRVGVIATAAAVLLLIVLFCSAWSNHAKAEYNWVRYWKDGGPGRERERAGNRGNTRNSGGLYDMRPREPSARERAEAARRRAAYVESVRSGEVQANRHGPAFVCHYCGRYVKAPCNVAFTAEGKVRLYRCPKCGKQNVTKI